MAILNWQTDGLAQIVEILSDYENLEIELPKNPVDSGEFDIDNEDLDDEEDLDYEPTDQQMMSAFGTKWHDKL